MDQEQIDRIVREHRRELLESQARVRGRIETLLIEYGLGYRADELLELPSPLLLASVQDCLSEIGLEVLESNLRTRDMLSEELRIHDARADCAGGQ